MVLGVLYVINILRRPIKHCEIGCGQFYNKYNHNLGCAVPWYFAVADNSGIERNVIVNKKTMLILIVAYAIAFFMQPILHGGPECMKLVDTNSIMILMVMNVNGMLRRPLRNNLWKNC